MSTDPHKKTGSPANLTLLVIQYSEFFTLYNAVFMSSCQLCDDSMRNYIAESSGKLR